MSVILCFAKDSFLRFLTKIFQRVRFFSPPKENLKVFNERSLMSDDKGNNGNAQYKHDKTRLRACVIVQNLQSVVRLKESKDPSFERSEFLKSFKVKGKVCPAKDFGKESKEGIFCKT